MWCLLTEPFEPSSYLRVFFNTAVLKGHANRSVVILCPVCCMGPISAGSHVFGFRQDSSIPCNIFPSRFCLSRDLLSVECCTSWMDSPTIFFSVFLLHAHLFYFPRDIAIYMVNGASQGFPGGSVVKNLPAEQELQETQIWSRGQEDPLEKGMATHSSILAWRISWTEDPGGLQSMWSQRIGHNCSNLACTHGASRVVLVVRNQLVNAGDVRDMGSFRGSGKSPGRGQSNPL